MSDRPIKLLLVDDDPIFRLGLSNALEPFSDLQGVAQADTATDALERIAELKNEKTLVVVLELGLGRFFPAQISGLRLCQQIKSEYPNLPIFLLSAVSEEQQLAEARASGVNGYCPKGTAIAQLVEALRQVASGEAYWRDLPTSPSQSDANVSPTQFSRPIKPPKWLYQLRQSGLHEIEASLAKVTSLAQRPQQSLFDWLFWSGRRRELLTARWLVNQLLPIEVTIVQEPSEQEEAPEKGGELLPISPSPYLSVTRAPQQPTLSILFDNTLAKVQWLRENRTGVPLELDILQPEKKRELLYLVLNQFRNILEELRFLQVTPEELPQRRSQILRDLWQSSTIDFFSKHYTPSPETRDYQIVDILLQGAAIIQEQILEKIPLVTDLLGYLLFEKPLVINNVPYRFEAPEAMARAEVLLQNLMIQVANGVMQLLLNHFAEVETIKFALYEQRFVSSREIARFRNDLSWRYRLERYFEEPKTIFESQYRLFVLNGNGIKRIFIYAPRQDQLNQLSGIRWVVTIALEARDATAPRLRAVVAFVGRGVVFLLTRVIGRGIGLIGRGIIQGIGNTLQDVRYGKNGERGK